jgi:hypothetical protein
MNKNTMMHLALALGLLVGAAACKKKPETAEGPMESAGDEVKEAAGDASDATEEAAEDTGDKVEEATDN